MAIYLVKLFALRQDQLHMRLLTCRLPIPQFYAFHCKLYDIEIVDIKFIKIFVNMECTRQNNNCSRNYIYMYLMIQDIEVKEIFWVLGVVWNFFSLVIRRCLELNLVLELGFVTLILIAGSWKRNWVFVTNSTFLISISLQPNVVYLWYVKLWILLEQII